MSAPVRSTPCESLRPPVGRLARVGRTVVLLVIGMVIVANVEVPIIFGMVTIANRIKVIEICVQKIYHARLHTMTKYIQSFVKQVLSEIVTVLVRLNSIRPVKFASILIYKTPFEV